MSQQGKRKTKRLLDFQARNQLGTPRGAAKSSGEKNFKLCAIVSKYVQHIFPVGAKIFLRGASPALVTGLWTDFYASQKINIFLRTLSVLAKFDLANQGVRQPVQLYAFNAQLPVFDETFEQPDFVVVNCSDVVMSVFHSPVLTRSLNFLQLPL